MLLVLGDGTALVLLLGPLIALLAPMAGVFAWRVRAQKGVSPSVNALGWTGVIWGVATIVGLLAGGVVDSPKAILVTGVLLTFVVVLSGGYQSGWLGWILLFVLGPIGSPVLLWRGVAPRPAAPAPAASAAEINDRTAGTTTLEMTPEIRSALADLRWILRATMLGGVALTAGSYALVTSPHVEEGLGTLALFLGFPVGVILFFKGLLSGELPLDRDLASGTYERTSGPVKLELHVFRRARNQLLVGDRDFSQLVRGSNGPNAFLDWTTLEWATIDRAVRSHVVLSIRDATGRVRYKMRGYRLWR